MSPCSSLLLRKISGRMCQKLTQPSRLLSWKSNFVLISVCISAHGMDDYHMCDGTINAMVYFGFLERHMLPSGWCPFLEVCGYFSRTVPDLIQQGIQWCGFIDTECLCLTVLPTGSYWKCMVKKSDRGSLSIRNLQSVQQEWTQNAPAKLR